MDWLLRVLIDLFRDALVVIGFIIWFSWIWEEIEIYFRKLRGG